MYKSKLKIWFWVFILSFILVTLKDAGLFSKKQYYVYSKEEDYFSVRFDNYKKSGAKVNLTNNIKSADVIINYSSDEEIEGFTKYPSQFNSKLVLCAQTECYYTNYKGNLYDIIKNDLSKYAPIKDLKTLLIAIENDKTYEDLGIPKNTLGSGTVKLVLPGKSLPYYDKCIELIAYALNNYSYDNIDSPELTKRVNNIISKCETYETEQSLQTKIFKPTEAKNRKLYIMPYYIDVAPTIGKYNDGYHSITFYLDKTFDIHYDMYLKEQDKNNYYDKFLKAIANYDFYYNVGLINIDADYNVSQVISSNHP